MNVYDEWQNSLINANKEKYRDFSDLKWLNPYNAEVFQKKRDQLIRSASNSWLFKETKPYHHQISQGCKLCGLGQWSCLFITNKCNANCFYCPAPQNNDEVPGTQSLSFPTPEEYASYINHFGFKGVSFSGGEPLLFFERTMEYLEHIRKNCAPGIYIWMYTNGILADEQKFRKLANAGLNEVRFDIGATGYKLDKIKFAKGIIPHITIEIPAVPEEMERLKKLLPEMIAAGVTNLNLHQLRLTKHNAPKLMKSNYTFVHAEHPLVLESELAALEILDHAKQNRLEIGINYCSFHFKNRFQKAGFRKKVAQAFANDKEFITENGFIRDYNENSIGYQTIRIGDENGRTNGYQHVSLPGKTISTSRVNVMRKTLIPPEYSEQTENLLLKEPDEIPEDPFLFKIWQMEYIEKGLREY